MKFLFHMVSVTAAGALAYASIPMEGATREEAVDKVHAGIEDGSIAPTWSTAQNPITGKDGTQVFQAGLESEDDDDGELWDGQKNTSTRQGGTGPSSGTTLPLNSPIQAAGARNSRNMAPMPSEPMAASAMPPAKMRAGEIPIERVGGAGDPTRSPTPAADGVTHLPASQRSQATPTPGKTFGMGGQTGGGNLRVMTGDEAAELAAGRSAVLNGGGRQMNSSSATHDTGGPGPAAMAAHLASKDDVKDDPSDRTKQVEQDHDHEAEHEPEPEAQHVPPSTGTAKTTPATAAA